jgi:hypothetical protein
VCGEILDEKIRASDPSEGIDAKIRFWMQGVVWCGFTMLTLIHAHQKA